MATPQGLSMSLDDMIRKSSKPVVRQGGGSSGGVGSSGGGSGAHGNNGGVRRMGAPYGSGVSKPGRSTFNQARRQPQHNNKIGGRGGGRHHPNRTEEEFWSIRRRAQSCFIEEATGDVVVQYHATIIVRISPEGDILLDSGGFHKAMTLASFNDVLASVGVKVSAPEAGRLEDSQWLVSDGQSLFRFQDGMTLGSKGPHSATRGPLVLQAFNNPSAAAATYASNVVAAQVGLLPKNAPGIQLDGNIRGPTQNRSLHRGAVQVRDGPYGGNNGSNGSSRAHAAARNRPSPGGRGRGSHITNNRRGPAMEQEWHPDMAASDTDMVVPDAERFEDEPFQHRQAGGYRSSGLEERYDLGGMRSQGWSGGGPDDDIVPPRHQRRVSPSNQQRRMYAQGRHG